MNPRVTGIVFLALALSACGKPGEDHQSGAASAPAGIYEQNTQPVEAAAAPAPSVDRQSTPVQASAPQQVTIPAQKPPPVVESQAQPVVESETVSEKLPLPRPRPRVANPSIAKAAELNFREKQLLALLNASRAQGGIPPLKFSRAQSSGTSKCIGSEGHSLHMAQTRNMSHDQFPQDICVRTRMSGENVGYASGDEASAIRKVHKLMMDEGPSGGHYQNIMSANYNAVGLGFYYSNGVLWVTENFLRL